MTNEEKYQLCLSEAQLILVKIKNQYPNSRYIYAGCISQDGSDATEGTAQMLQAAAKYMPDVIKAINGTVANTAQTNLDANRLVAPGQAQLESDIANQQAMSASQGELALAQGPGRQLVTEADLAQKQLDPEYYKTRNQIGEALDQFLGGASATLSPTDIAQINRGISSREGSNMAPSALNTLRNAQTFGTAGDAKRNNFGNVISTAASITPSLRSGISGFEVATRRALSTPTKTDAAAASNTNFGFANNTLDQIGALQLKQAKDSFNKDQALTHIGQNAHLF